MNSTSIAAQRTSELVPREYDWLVYVKIRLPKEFARMYRTHAATRASVILRLQDADDVAAADEFAAINGPLL